MMSQHSATHVSIPADGVHRFLRFST